MQRLCTESCVSMLCVWVCVCVCVYARACSCLCAHLLGGLGDALALHGVVEGVRVEERLHRAQQLAQVLTRAHIVLGLAAR